MASRFLSRHVCALVPGVKIAGQATRFLPGLRSLRLIAALWEQQPMLPGARRACLAAACCLIWLIGWTPEARPAHAAEPPRPASVPAERPEWLLHDTPYPLLMPVDGVVSSPYGLRRLPIARRGSRVHRAIDILAEAGAPVVAAAEGEVVSACPRGGYGNCVDIRHSGRLVTRYAHLRDIAVTAGQRVRKGERVGSVGATGHATGPNLHFETIYKNQKVDPIRFVGKQKVIPRIRGGESILKIKGKGYQ
jgi:Membrane proteins related to metalloendopeptidases